MKIPPHALRTVFALSVVLTAFWMVGIAWDAVAGRDLPIAVLAIVAVLVAAAVSFRALRGTRLVVPPQLGAGDVVRSFVPRVIGAYMLAVPVVGLSTWLLIRLFSQEPSDPESGVLVGLMAVWLPLWFAPALGVEWWWRAMRKRRLA